MPAPDEDETLTMDDIMRRWPAAIGPILRHRLLCVGCPVAAFHSLDDAIRAHGIGEAAFRSDLAAAIGPPRGRDPR
jgi:hybrid cluster-associated redox disulfide protein